MFPTFPVQYHHELGNVLTVGFPSFKCTVVGILDSSSAELVSNGEVKIECGDWLVATNVFNVPILCFHIRNRFHEYSRNR